MTHAAGRMDDAHQSILPLLHRKMPQKWRSTQAASGTTPYAWQGSQWEKYATGKRTLKAMEGCSRLVTGQFEIIAQQLPCVANDIWPQRVKGHTVAVVERH